jgi:hypothetical protein
MQCVEEEYELRKTMNANVGKPISLLDAVSKLKKPREQRISNFI